MNFRRCALAVTLLRHIADCLRKLLSAMPTGVFTAIFAAQYETAGDTASGAIVVSTVLGALTIAAWLSFFSALLVV